MSKKHQLNDRRSESFRERLRIIRGTRTYAEFGKVLGFQNATSYLYEIETGKKNLSLRLLYALIDQLSVDSQWLLTGAPRLTSEPTEYIQNANLVNLSLLDTHASSGTGNLSEEDTIESSLRFSTETFQTLFHLNHKDSYALIHIKGESMMPTLRNQSLALVDTAVNNIESNGQDEPNIYSFRWKNEIFIKRLKFRDEAQDMIVVMSDNKKYPSFFISNAADKDNEFSLLGQVIASAQIQKHL